MFRSIISFLFFLLLVNDIKCLNIQSKPFELDGNSESSGATSTVINGVSYPKDWNYFASTPYNDDGFYATGIIVDAGTQTTFEQNAKDTMDCSLWTWGPDNNAQAKTDIYHVMSYAQPYGNDLILYFGADRIGGSGITANSAFGYWFLQDPLFGITGTTSGGFTGTHFDGDLLVVCDFSNPPNIAMYKWTGVGTSGSLTSLTNNGLLSVKCDPTKNQTVCAIFNSASSPTTLGYPGNVYQATTFMEGGIDVRSWLTTSTGQLPCFNNILSMTRTSTSTSATLKDFGLGKFALCTTNADIDCDASTVTINNDGTYTFHYTVTIDHTGVGSIYNVIVNVPPSQNALNAPTTIAEVSPDQLIVLPYQFTSTSNRAVINDIVISYCLYPNCDPVYRRTLIAAVNTCVRPTLSPTSMPTYAPSALPTAAPVTKDIELNAECTTTIDATFRYIFSWKWTLCNEGDRAINNAQITTRKSSYSYTVNQLAAGACTSQSVTFNPTRFGADDPIANGFVWSDTIDVTATMIVGGTRQITVSTSDSFSCNLCI